MSILGDVVGGLLGGGGSNSPMHGVLMNMLGGGQAANNQQGQGYSGSAPASGGLGGLGGLVSAFQQAGLGNIVQSWIGTGGNQPVSPDQLQNVLGQDRVQSMASQSGMAPNDFLSQLSQHLPHAVDRITPNGQLPDEGTVSV